VASRKGLSVLVAEEHETIGEPEKCDGLVSLKGLKELGFLPSSDVIQSRVSRAVIHSPGGAELVVDASSADVVVLDRSAYDRQVAGMARGAGAAVAAGTRVTGFRDLGDRARLMVGGKETDSRYYVDATGPASSPRSGIVLAAKYEVEADWVREGVVEIFLDAEKYPGFFAWVIPYGKDLAKVGAAGRGINSRAVLESFLARGKHRVIRKVVAPIYIGGPTAAFCEGRRLKVGESAGMVKPTTAGGIVTSLAGGSVAADWLARALGGGDQSLLDGYQSEWESRYGKEMLSMKRLRRLFEQLSNKQLDSLVGVISAPKIAERLSRSDFDFHASGLVRALGVRGVVQLAKIGATAEAKALLAG